MYFETYQQVKSKKAVDLDENFMNTSGMESSEVDYRKVSVGDSMIGTGAVSGKRRCICSFIKI